MKLTWCVDVDALLGSLDESDVGQDGGVGGEERRDGARFAAAGGRYASVVRLRLVVVAVVACCSRAEQRARGQDEDSETGGIHLHLQGFRLAGCLSAGGGTARSLARA